jgi:hypothetical protein
MRRLAAALAVAALLASTAGAHGRAKNDRQNKKKDRRRDRGTSAEIAPLVETRTIDGSGNNATRPDLGRAGTAFRRIASVAYEDGVGAPAGGDRPSARAISNALCAQDTERPSTAGATDLVWQWGQFLDHDIDLTPVAAPAQPFDIAVPAGDPWFDPLGTGIVTIGLDRSYGETLGGVRQQFNDITAFIDASNVYGSDEETARSLRTLDGTGRLLTSDGRLLPMDGEGFFLAGDVRANEQVALTSMHTLFVREHNYWAGRIGRAMRSRRGRARVAGGRLTRGDLGVDGGRERLTGDEIYELARAIVGAEMQAITYREFLPVLLGPDALPPYTGYDPDVDPTIANEFATAAYRVGHTMLSSTLRRLGRDGESIEAGDLPLLGAFFHPQAITDEGIEPLLRGLCSHVAQEVDPYVVDDVRNFLFGPPGAGGFDLASLNIQRGGDHGLPSYTRLRGDLGLPPVTSLAEISSDATITERLHAAYDDVEQVDVWAGGLAEDHVPGALVGETFHRVLVDQFAALRDGDRFWYRQHLSPGLVELVEEQTLARIMRRNTRIRGELSGDIWQAR